MTLRPLLHHLLLLALSSAALPQDSRPGPSDLLSLAATVAGDDLAARRAALKSIARVFNEAGDAAAASAPNNARKHEARLRARGALAAQHGAAMRPLLERGVESALLADLRIEAIRSRLDALWDLRVSPARVVAALGGALSTGSDVYDLIPEIAAYDRDGAAATPVLLQLATSDDHRRRQAAQWALYDMGLRARGAQQGLVDAFLASAPSSQPKPATEAESRRALDLRDRIDLLQPLYEMGPAPEPLVRRAVAAIESNPEENRYLIGILASLDPSGAVIAPLARDRFFRDGDSKFASGVARWDDPRPIVAELIRRLELPGAGVSQAAVEALADLGPVARSAAPALIRLYEARPGRILGSTDILRTELKRKVGDALFKIEADPDEIFRVLSPVLATEEDSWRLEPLCDQLEKLKLMTPPVGDLATTLADHGSDLEAHRAAFMIGRLGSDGATAVPALALALNRDSSSLRWIAARSLSKIGPGAASAIPDLVEALRDEARSAESRPVESRRRPWTFRQSEVCEQLVNALGAIGPAAKEVRPVMMAALAAVRGVEPGATYELAYEDFDRIAPPDRPAAAVVEDPTLTVASSARWMPGNRGAESRPFHAEVTRDPDGQARLRLYDIRKWREFWVSAWTRTLFLNLDATGKLLVTSELWCHHGGGRPHCTKHDPKLPAIRIRPADLARAERLEIAYDEGDDWIEVTVPNPFRK